MSAATSALWSEEAGREDGPVIAVIHGSMDRSAGLLKLSRRLDDEHRVVRYDRRGYGRSTPHDGPFGMDGQVADLVTVLRGRPAVLFGHSYGGNVALATAERHPELVRAVGVYESPLSWLDWWPATTAGGDALSTGDDPASAAERFMRRLIGDDRWERLPPSTRVARRAEGQAMIGELTDLRERAPWHPAGIQVPSMVLRGSEGADHHRRSTEHIGAVVPGCEVIVIDGARHFGPNTHPDQVAAAISGLVARVSP